MSREIKFDFIYKGDFQFHHKKYYLDELIDNSLSNLSDVHGQMKLIAKRQFTGHKDKNGKEIYEVDILGFKSLGKWSKVVVDWMLGQGGFNLPRKAGWGIVDTSGYEIIGNIYENPELLEK
jgi:hypothetical protein